MKQTKNILTVLLASTIIIFTGCKKDFDTVPVKELPSGNIITIDSLRNIFNGADTTFTEDYSIYGVVTADEVTGNIYKELYIQDETNAIKLGLTSSSDFYIGDRVRVSLKGATITDDGSNMLTIDGVDPDAAIIRQESNKDLTPAVVTITDINSLINGFSAYQGKLVQINNVEFQCSEMCATWANAIDQFDENRYLEDTLGNSIVVRSSGFSTFAGTTLPTGQGSIIAVVSQYNGTIQLTIRNPNEATLYAARKNVCPFISKNFDDQILTSCDWTTKHISGPVSTAWEIYASSNSAASVSNYDPGVGAAVASESWLISPSVNLSATTNPTLNFRNVVNFSLTPELQVLVSTNYDGVSDPNTATWIDLTSQAALDTDDTTFNSWTNSGNISLTPYKQSNVYIAFKLIGTSAASSTWEIDDVVVQDI